MMSSKSHEVVKCAVLMLLMLHIKHLSCTDTSAGDLHKEYACEWGEVVMLCEDDMVIEVVDVLYGRDGHLTCYNPDYMRTTNCSEPSAHGTVSARCDGRRSCRVLSSNHLFGDPCPGTAKYLEVLYNCTDRGSNLQESTDISLSTPPVTSGSPADFNQGTASEELACEWDEVALVCEHGTVIQVLDVLWGRDDHPTCHNPDYALTTDCISPTALTEVRRRCEGRESCRLLASYQLFGDPCPGTAKYLKVTYNCTGPSSTGRIIGSISSQPTSDVTIPPSSSLAQTNSSHPESEHMAVACENDDVALLCEGDRPYISIVDAFYGRDAHDTCPDASYSLTTSCSASHVVDITRGRCDARSSCRIPASNQLFGEHCLGTYKYLKVYYNCTDTPLPDALHKDLSCEHGDVTMLCENNSVIEIVDAFFGRDGLHKCHNPAYTLTTNCSHSGVVDIVRERCESEETCHLSASTSVFGEPCWGTYKYLEVTYRCRGLSGAWMSNIEDVTTNSQQTSSVSSLTSSSSSSSSLSSSDAGNIPESSSDSSHTSDIPVTSPVYAAINADSSRTIGFSDSEVDIRDTLPTTHHASRTFPPTVAQTSSLSSVGVEDLTTQRAESSSQEMASEITFNKLQSESSTMYMLPEGLQDVTGMTDGVGEETWPFTESLAEEEEEVATRTLLKTLVSASSTSQSPKKNLATDTPVSVASDDVGKDLDVNTLPPSMTQANQGKDVDIKTGQVKQANNAISKPLIAVAAVLICFIIIAIVTIYIYKHDKVKHRPNIIYLGRGTNSLNKFMHSHEKDGQAGSQFALVDL